MRSSTVVAAGLVAAANAQQWEPYQSSSTVTSWADVTVTYCAPSVTDCIVSPTGASTWANYDPKPTNWANAPVDGAKTWANEPADDAATWSNYPDGAATWKNYPEGADKTWSGYEPEATTWKNYPEGADKTWSGYEAEATTWAGYEAGSQTWSGYGAEPTTWANYPADAETTWKNVPVDGASTWTQWASKPTPVAGVTTWSNYGEASVTAACPKYTAAGPPSWFSNLPKDVANSLAAKWTGAPPMDWCYYSYSTTVPATKTETWSAYGTGAATWSAYGTGAKPAAATSSGAWQNVDSYKGAANANSGSMAMAGLAGLAAIMLA